MRVLQFLLVVLFLIGAATEANTLAGTMLVGAVTIGSLLGAITLERHIQRGNHGQ